MRNRLTWNNRKASAAPAIPGMEGSVDADVSKLVKGGPSEFGEDVYRGPTTQSAAPALPGYEALQAAMDAGVVPEMSHEEIMAVEKKASKCLRIAKAMLGKTASADAVEAQALDLMDLPETQVDATLSRVAAMFLAEDLPVAAPGSVPLATEEKKGKKAEGDELADRVAEMEIKLSEVHAALMSKHAEPEAEKEKAMKSASLSKTAEDMLSEMLLESMLKEAADEEPKEEAPAEEAPAEEAPAEGEEKKKKQPGSVKGLADEYGLTPEVAEAIQALIDTKVEKALAKVEGAEEAPAEEAPAEEAPAEKTAESEHLAFDFEAESDALLGDGDSGNSKDAEEMLASLFAEASDDGMEAEAEDKLEVEADDKMEAAPVAAHAMKTAGLRPQPRKVSTGAKTLGAVTKVASSETDDLSKLWESAPDVSDYFNSSRWGK